MKKIHILNIGHPRCGTTWLWNQLRQQPWFDVPSFYETDDKDIFYGKENPSLLLGVTMQQYQQQYDAFDITGNFCTLNILLDRYQICQLANLETTVVTMMIRNPFDQINSMKNYLSWTEDHASNKSWFFRHDKILDRWQRYFPSQRLKIYSYDALNSDPASFLQRYFQDLKLPRIHKISMNKINDSKSQIEPLNLTLSHRDVINDIIDRLQSQVPFPVLHWKQKQEV